MCLFVCDFCCRCVYNDFCQSCLGTIGYIGLKDPEQRHLTGSLIPACEVVKLQTVQRRNILTEMRSKCVGNPSIYLQLVSHIHDGFQQQNFTCGSQSSFFVMQAMIKIVMHAKSGAPLEVMGLMQGKVTAERDAKLVYGILVVCYFCHVCYVCVCVLCLLLIAW